MEYGGTLQRPSLGNIAALGQLYDARNDQFCELSIFKKEIPDEAVSVTDAHFSDIQLVTSDRVSDKFHKLDVKAELQVSVLAGLISLEGSGRYLEDQNKSARSMRNSLVFNIKTKDEQLNINHESLKDAWNLEAIKNGGGTHVVVGITWGANSILSCLYENKEERDHKEVDGQLGVTMKSIFGAIKGKGDVTVQENESGLGLNFEFQILGDILPKENEMLPTTMESGLEMMKQLPSLVKTCNGGKGKPLTYRLVPISFLLKYLQFKIEVDMTVTALDEESLLRAVKIFEEIRTVQQKLYDFHQDVINNKQCVPRQDVEQIISAKGEMTIQESNFRSKLAKVLVAVRSGHSEMSEVEDLLVQFQESKFSPQNVEVMLFKWKFLYDKISLAKLIQKHGGKYIGEGDELDQEIIKDFGAKTYILYFMKERINEPKQWKKNRQIFLQELNKGSNNDCRFYVVDCDFHPMLIPSSKTSVIQVISSGAMLSEDLLVDLDKLKQTPVAYASTGTVKTTKKPNKRAPLMIRCTGQTCNPSVEYEWQCRGCCSQIEFGFDDNVYCFCGKTPIKYLGHTISPP